VEVFLEVFLESKMESFPGMAQNKTVQAKCPNCDYSQE